MPRSPKSSESAGWYRKSTLLLALIALVAAFLGGLIWAGRWGLDQVRGRDRYEVPFADIACNPPVGLSKAEFLDEVRFKGRLPEKVNVLDEDLPQRLRDGFASHPWVESVADVQITPPKQIVVELVHRTPVLAVKIGAETRVVDSAGILLRKNTATLGLPVYEGDVKVAPGSLVEGTRLGDPNVVAAARRLRK